MFDIQICPLFPLMSCRMPSVQFQTFLHPTYLHQHSQQTFVIHWRILEKKQITYFFMISQLNLPTHSSFFPLTDITRRAKTNAKKNVFISYDSLSNLGWQLLFLCILAFRFGFIHISCTGQMAKFDWLEIWRVTWYSQKRKKKVRPRFELGSWDSESQVLTVTPSDRTHWSNVML